MKRCSFQQCDNFQQHPGPCDMHILLFNSLAQGNAWNSHRKQDIIVDHVGSNWRRTYRTNIACLLVEDKEAVIYNICHSCWLRGDAMNQVISSHCIDIKLTVCCQVPWEITRHIEHTIITDWIIKSNDSYFRFGDDNEYRYQNDWERNE